MVLQITTNVHLHGDWIQEFVIILDLCLCAEGLVLAVPYCEVEGGNIFVAIEWDCIVILSLMPKHETLIVCCGGTLTCSWTAVPL